ncbi:MAG: type III-A CRISPR-associated protein Csm2 [Desulfovibrio sp.]|jgi:CRISPR-associated protein Csm2|nr:type III-A CRISPR-associated protein Csm2 [Desulfovibrio sp.]
MEQRKTHPGGGAGYPQGDRSGHNRNFRQDEGRPRQDRNFRPGGDHPRSGRQSEPSRLTEEDLAKIDFGEGFSSDIFSKIAQEAAEKVFGGRGVKNKRTQLRRFYDELAMWSERVQQEPGKERDKKYKEFEPFIKMMQAKVAYALGRDHIDATFNALFSHCVDKINAPESLKRCKLFMEAFMGFYRMYEK